MKYLLDTNTLIYFFRGQGRVAERMLGTPVSEVALSAVLLVGSVWVVLRTAGTVYSRTLLHRGSRITWREALRLRGT